MRCGETSRSPTTRWCNVSSRFGANSERRRTASRPFGDAATCSTARFIKNRQAIRTFVVRRRHRPPLPRDQRRRHRTQVNRSALTQICAQPLRIALGVVFVVLAVIAGRSFLRPNIATGPVPATVQFTISPPPGTAFGAPGLDQHRNDRHRVVPGWLTTGVRCHGSCRPKPYLAAAARDARRATGSSD